MERYEQFLQNEQSIYDKIRKQEATLHESGLSADPAIKRKIGGLAVVARHQRLVGKLSTLTCSLKGCFSCLVYDGTNEHSTFCVKDEPDFVFNPCLHKEKLIALAETVAAVLANMSIAQQRECIVRYDKPLYNATTVILPGEPRQAYVDLLLTISDTCTKRVYVRPSWGSHITIARFLRAHQPSEIESFLRFMSLRAQAVGENLLDTIDVIVFRTTHEAFQLTTFERFTLEH